MPRGRIKRGVKAEPGKFFSMEINPEGASIGNFVKNITSIPKAFKEVGEALTKTKITRSRGRGRSSRCTARSRSTGARSGSTCTCGCTGC